MNNVNCIYPVELTQKSKGEKREAKKSCGHVHKMTSHNREEAEVVQKSISI